VATAEELRQRIAALNQDTAARTAPNPASESMRARMAQLDRNTARTLRGAPTAPAGSSFTAPGVQVIDRTASTAARGNGLGQRFANARDAVVSQRGVGPPKPPGMLGRAWNVFARNPRVQLATAVAAGLGGSSILADEERQRDAFTRLGGDFAGNDIEDANAATAALGLLDIPTLGLAGAASRFTGAVENPRTLSDGSRESGLDRFFGGVQAVIDPDEARRRRGLAVPERGVAALGEVTPQGQRVTPEIFSTAGDGLIGAAPVNTIRTADGRVLPVNPDVQVNTMSPENFTRIGSGLSQRLGDARLTAAERGDFGQLETDRAAFEGQLDTNRQIVADYERQQAEALLARSGGVTGRRLAPVSQREGSAARTAMATLAQLNADADRNAGVESERIAAESRRAPPENPLMNPQVIAERLRQEGADRRQDTGQDLFRGLEPIEDIQGGVTGFQGLDSQGVPVVIPQAELPVLQSQFQQFRTNGTIPPNMSFADFVSRINAATAQG